MIPDIDKPENETLLVLEEYVRQKHPEDSAEKKAKVFEKLVKNRQLTQIIDIAVRRKKPAEKDGKGVDLKHGEIPRVQHKSPNVANVSGTSGVESRETTTSAPSETGERIPIERFEAMFEYMLERVREDEREKLAKRIMENLSG